MMYHPNIKFWVPTNRVNSSVIPAETAGITTITNATGKIDNAVDFSSGQYMSFTTNQFPRDPITICFWLNVKSGNIIGNTIFSNSPAGTGIIIAGHAIMFTTTTSISWLFGDGVLMHMLTWTATVDTWQHIGLTYDHAQGSNNVKLYIDGSLYQTETDTVSVGLDRSFGGMPTINGLRHAEPDNIQNALVMTENFMAFNIVLNEDQIQQVMRDEVPYL